MNSSKWHSQNPGFPCYSHEAENEFKETPEGLCSLGCRTTAKENSPVGSGKQDLREKLRKQQSLQDQLEMFMKSGCHLHLWLGMKNEHKSCAELPFFQSYRRTDRHTDKLWKPRKKSGIFQRANYNFFPLEINPLTVIKLPLFLRSWQDLRKAWASERVSLLAKQIFFWALSALINRPLCKTNEKSDFQ